MNKRVLALLADGVEELELVAPVDVLRRAGAEVVMAVVGDGIHVTGRNGIVLHGDARLTDVDAKSFDLLLIPGGAAVAALRQDGTAAQLAKNFVAEGKAVAAICAGPLVLEDAGLLEGKRFTAHFSAANELPGAQVGERVVEDGLVITSRGAGTALEFGLALVDRLFGEAREEEIARAIMS
ncbi:MAG: DJ-1/PfpI family protein [Chthoniobacterales bacterium]|nr:DJ-1/PfpI family protein [Chthoniobacterales bacterium]